MCFFKWTYILWPNVYGQLTFTATLYEWKYINRTSDPSKLLSSPLIGELICILQAAMVAFLILLKPEYPQKLYKVQIFRKTFFFCKQLKKKDVQNVWIPLKKVTWCVMKRVGTGVGWHHDARAEGGSAVTNTRYCTGSPDLIRNAGYILCYLEPIKCESWVVVSWHSNKSFKTYISFFCLHVAEWSIRRRHLPG